MKYLLPVLILTSLSACLKQMSPDEVRQAQEVCHKAGLDAEVTRWNGGQPMTIACVPKNTEGYAQ